MPFRTTLAGGSARTQIDTGPAPIDRLSDGMRAQVARGGLGAVVAGQPEA